MWKHLIVKVSVLLMLIVVEIAPKGLDPKSTQAFLVDCIEVRINKVI